MFHRRRFLHAVGAGGVLLGARWAWAEDPLLEESDPKAVEVAYVADARQVDAARHPNFRPEQNCANCAVYTGASGEPAGGCVLFAHRRVLAAGWCSAWSGDG